MPRERFQAPPLSLWKETPLTLPLAGELPSRLSFGYSATPVDAHRFANVALAMAESDGLGEASHGDIHR